MIRHENQKHTFGGFREGREERGGGSVPARKHNAGDLGWGCVGRERVDRKGGGGGLMTLLIT